MCYILSFLASKRKQKIIYLIIAYIRLNILLKCMQQIFNVNIMFLLLINYPSD